jgi:hypothetical protein
MFGLLDLNKKIKFYICFIYICAMHSSLSDFDFGFASPGLCLRHSGKHFVSRAGARAVRRFSFSLDFPAASGVFYFPLPILGSTFGFRFLPQQIRRAGCHPGFGFVISVGSFPVVESPEPLTEIEISFFAPEQSPGPPCRRCSASAPGTRRSRFSFRVAQCPGQRFPPSKRHERFFPLSDPCAGVCPVWFGIRSSFPLTG